MISTRIAASVASLAVWCWCLWPSVARADRVDDLVHIVGAAASHRVRAQAAQVLGKSTDPRAVDALLVALADPSDAVRGSAASALGAIGDARSVPALERLRRDGSVYVRDSASLALDAITKRASSQAAKAPPPSPGMTRYLATVNVTKGSSEASQILKEVLTRDLSRLPRLATTPDATTQKLSAWELEATITNLTTTGERLDCDVELVIATLPVRSIRAKVRAGASFNGVRLGAHDPKPQRECLKGASQLLTEDVDKFFKAQSQP